MSVISRTYVFAPGTRIVSAQVNQEFNSIVNLLNGTDLASSVYIGGANVSNLLSLPKLYVLGQSEFSSSSSGRVVGVFKDGEANPRVALYNSGQVRQVASQHSVTPSTVEMVSKGTLYASATNIGNVGVGEDTLHTFAVGANVLNGQRDYFTVEAGGITAANGNNKQLKFYCKLTAILATGVITENNKPWFFKATVIYDNDGVSTVAIYARFICGATDVRTYQLVTSYDFTIDNTWSFTGEAVSDNDLVQGFTIVEKGWSIN